MVFDSVGRFIDEIEFDDAKLNEISRDESDLALSGRQTARHVNRA